MSATIRMVHAFGRVAARQRRAFRANEGIAAIEFAFIVPVLLILLMGAVDMGQMLYTYYRLDQAVAAGSQYAALNGGNVNSTGGGALASSIATIVENANGSAWANDAVVVNDGPSVTVASGTATTGGTASNADSCYCPTGSGSTWAWGSAMECGAACPSGEAGKFVTITASYNYVPLVRFYSFITNATLSRTGTVQTR
ncbi:MAG: TadE/TadG family type IV pilus assembly protein [Rhizomicrobium sp.]